MKSKTTLFLLAFLAILSSCATLKTKTTKTMDIYGDGVIQIPVVVDLDVSSEKAVAKLSTQTLTVDLLKNEVVAELLKKSDADVLIEPKFEIEIKGSITTISVSGYPASYTNFRQIQASDVDLLNVGIAQKANAYEPTPAVTNKKKGGKGLAIGGSILAGLALTLLIIGMTN